ncbi:HAD-IA family hydrolase [Saccharopolyspora sp. K220]|uniref:HAD-IA family hydrolase n=1 Tax=Saccharopolyspora soli TaxID=2926618 RepID=UPI001F5AB3EF|nr:HAD-IA family hydrolase [Saccharopolyspora soli]MCI2422157.1 HAD-IA family hydrolase [Saccharopolyspora soli]
MELKGLLLDYAGVLDDPGDAISGAPPLFDVVRCARRSGINTALVSNADALGDPEVMGLFDTVVLSGAVGVAKPNAGIYLLTARRLGLEPRQCVFVDDLHRNVVGAVAAGMVGVHHRDVASTVTELVALLDLELPT